MKKIKVMLTVFCVCISCLLLLTACSAKLSAPSSFRLDMDTLTLHWNRVKMASAYQVEIGDTISVTTRENSYCLESLEPGEYIVKIRAITYGDDHEDSEIAEFKFTREQESGLRYQLNSGRTGYELIGIGDAEGDVVMEDYYRGKPVVGIAKAALRRCGRITSFVIGNNVKTIGDNAFAGCAQLTSITIPEGVTFIGESAFQSCNGLQTVNLPNSLEAISPYTFSMCKNLESVVVGKDVNSIGAYAFADCVLLKEINISEGVETLCEYVFSGCVSLDKVQFGGNMKNIERYAFYGCEALTNISLNDQLLSIGEGAFASSGLVSVTIPDSVTVLDRFVFSDCLALAEVTLGSGLKSIGVNAFGNTAFVNNYEGDVIVAGNWEKKEKNPEVVTFEFPEEVVGIASAAFIECKLLDSVELDAVKYIGAYAFANCESLYAVFTGDALEEIGDNAFANCAVLWTVELGNNVKTIGNGAFAYCIRLEDSGINIPASVQSIGSGAFINTQLYNNPDNGFVYVDDWLVDIHNQYMYEDEFIKEGTRGIANYAMFDMAVNDGKIYLPDSIEIIGRCAFYNNTSLRLVNLPANLKYVGDYAFAGCEANIFTSDHVIRIPNGCEYVGAHAFRDCKSAISLYIPSSVKYIGDRAFKGCINLGYSQFKLNNQPNSPNVIGDVIINEGVEFMGEQVFYGCSGLLSITLPDSLQTIGPRAFYRCEMLESLTIGSGLKEIPAYSFYNCSALKEVTVPGNVRNIGAYAFRGCSALRSITLAEGVESIDRYAFFKATDVRYLSIADSVTYIGDYSFRNMERISAIYLHGNISYVGKLAFHGAKNAVIYMENVQIPETWSARWNGSFMPVVSGVKLSDDNAHVVSWSSAEGKIENISSFVSLVDPSRTGYTFIGWSTTENDTAWQYADLTEVPENTTVYSVWTEGEPEDIPETLPEESVPAPTTLPNTVEGR